MLLFVMASFQRRDKEKTKQISKTKRRLVKVLKTFELFKESTLKKEKFGSKLDKAARKIQREWRKRRQKLMQRDTKQVTHRYIKEKLQADQIKCQLEDTQIQTGRLLIQESLNQVQKMMGCLRYEMLQRKEKSGIK